MVNTVIVSRTSESVVKWAHIIYECFMEPAFKDFTLVRRYSVTCSMSRVFKTWSRFLFKLVFVLGMMVVAVLTDLVVFVAAPVLALFCVFEKDPHIVEALYYTLFSLVAVVFSNSCYLSFSRYLTLFSQFSESKVSDTGSSS